jgi:hypothetical protein
MSGDCLYFTRFTVDSEGSYYPASPELVARFVADGRSVPEIAALADDCKQRFGIDVFREIGRGPDASNPLLAKTVQGIFYTSLAYFLARYYRRPISAVGFYSAGVIPAYHFAGVLNLDEYLNGAYSFVNAYFAARDEQARVHELSQVLLRAHEGENVESFVEELIAGKGLGAQVFVKDRRQPHVVLVAGHTHAVSVVEEAALAAIPSISAHETRRRRVNAAHLPLIDRTQLLPMLDKVKFAPPRYAVVGTRGQIVPRGSDDAAALKDVFVEAVTGPMNTGESVRAIGKVADEVLAIGSQHSLKVFDGIAPQTLPGMRLAADDLFTTRAA